MFLLISPLWPFILLLGIDTGFVASSDGDALLDSNSGSSVFSFSVSLKACTAFSFTWLTAVQICWSRRKFLRKKRVQLPQG